MARFLGSWNCSNACSGARSRVLPRRRRNGSFPGVALQQARPCGSLWTGNTAIVGEARVKVDRELKLLLRNDGTPLPLTNATTQVCPSCSCAVPEGAWFCPSCRQLSTAGVPNLVQATLTDALGYLSHKYVPKKAWGDVRSTATALWALGEVVASRLAVREASPVFESALEAGHRWLLKRMRKEEDERRSWESEAWDTSVSLIALAHATPSPGEEINLAVDWLLHVGYDGIWYDEVWESVLSMIALLRVARGRAGPRQAHLERLAAPTRELLGWLNTLPAKEDGEFINAHYSAFITWLLAEIENSGVDSAVGVERLTAFKAKVNNAVEWFIAAANAKPRRLWSRHTFANAYAAYALSRRDRPDTHDAMICACRWFAERHGRSAGGFDNVEDAALVSLALLAMAPRIGVDVTIDVSHL